VSKPAGAAPEVKPASAAVRWAHGLFGLLVLEVGVLALAFSDSTDRYFSWTIAPSLTAAFLGGGYISSLAMEILAVRERFWARSRIAVAGIWVFSTALLVATLLHLDRFHLDDAPAGTVFFTWSWLVVYALVPLVLPALWLYQRRLPGGDPPRVARLPAALRPVLALQGAVLLGVGAALFAAPAAADGLWPWTLSPLTGRAVAAWLLGLATLALVAAWEDDLERASVGMGAFAVFGPLQILVAALYAGGVDWSGGHIWVYVAFLASMGAAGAGVCWAGLTRSRRALRSPQPGPPAPAAT
jgi:hypothetical protein